ncbi:two component transcriptional regulator, LuxR family [Streptoalloteichus tenebrarius]|uniref:Two component transcriptional regulator, LuxR family n=1 Tax=Streptoalloteichus tenebrarius (strain ATCC 17920 / DSM 40477 / JCM 4838 / CBS 697.72 / NBRC 16177 / NCIMB 11028 / NRRL B-12390 / A12253. 1 / ISP 5477) TaxID=1933 RepID=A0ABT1HZM9_STRSD|nr:response regulator transcription factor [Streptoalloteichus tenebrarius]MCP2260992.1 two component transcriptional regulator, LuxR family [Streptoalloteichus tenebrarius]BFE98931.1 response regulator transcription factor [Streptoalloteichus tenebrarius]
MIRVVICDDAPIVRMGLRMLVAAEDDLDVVAEAAHGVEALEQVRRTRPDVLLLDLEMPRLHGIEVIASVVDQTRVLVLTTFERDDYVHAALRGGASGFLVKDAPPDQVVSAIRAVAAGQAWLSPTVTRTLLSTVAPTLPCGDPRLRDLSTSDIRLLGLLGRGHSNTEIAAELDLTPATVKTYVSRLLGRLGVRDRTQAALLARDAGLTTPGFLSGSGEHRESGPGDTTVTNVRRGRSGRSPRGR